MKGYCALCGHEREDHNRSFHQPNVEGLNPKTEMPNKVSEHITIKIEVAANRWDFNFGTSEDFCEICEGRINNHLKEIEKMMWDIFQNKVWREVDKVYETRIDCQAGRLKAA